MLQTGLERLLKDPACRIKGSVRELRWDEPAEREAICEIVRQHASGTGPGLTEPILMRGPAKHWGAVEKWSLDSMARRWPKLWYATVLATLLLFAAGTRCYMARACSPCGKDPGKLGLSCSVHSRLSLRTRREGREEAGLRSRHGRRARAQMMCNMRGSASPLQPRGD